MSLGGTDHACVVVCAAVADMVPIVPEVHAQRAYVPPAALLSGFSRGCIDAAVSFFLHPVEPGSILS